MTNAIESQGSVFSILTTAPSTFTVVAEVKDFSGFGGSASVIDVSTLTSTAKEKLMGLQDFGQFTINFNHAPTDAGQVALAAAKASRDKQTFKLVLNDTPSTTYTFDGYVVSKSINGGVDSAVTGSVTIEITGDVTES